MSATLEPIVQTITMPDGKVITLETGKLARQAHGSVLVKAGRARLLATVVSNHEAREGVDFLPLSVDYQEKFASAGRIPGGFLRREGRLSDYEVLICRLVDRALRPMFPKDYHSETQMMISLLSYDPLVPADALAGLAASAALSITDIPFDGPISEVRVAKVDGELVINPTTEEIEAATLEMLVAGTADAITMVEGEMNEVSEEEMAEAIFFAHDAIKVQVAAQLELRKKVGVSGVREYSHESHDEALRARVKEQFYEAVKAAARKRITSKHDRSDALKKPLKDYLESLPEGHEENVALIKAYYKEVEKKAVRDTVLEDRIRMDNRQLDQVRQIWTEADYLPSTHGSALFTRGETQSLTSVTLGTKQDEQMIDQATGKSFEKFILHYNFPSFSTGEARPNRGPGRREIGHGNLAFRALKKALPPMEEMPYTIRVVSDILESNGSSSMATVCAGSMALMDAGIHTKAAVSGIAMGLISDEETGKYAILSDILGDEDFLGDMDFKVAGTEKGITATQMDIKIKGLSRELLVEALQQARKGRMEILAEMNKTISEPRGELKPHAPRSHIIVIDGDKIGAVIGPGGKVVQQIQKETGATISIDEIPGNKGQVSIFAVDQSAMDAAVSWVRSIVAEAEVGETYTGKVKNITPFGAFVEFMPGKDGLLHISEIKWARVEKVEDVLEVGEEIKVKLIEIDQKTGKFRLSRKALLPKPAAAPAEAE